MGLESGSYINDLVITNPTGSDGKNQGDDHLRLIKTADKNSFPGFTGAVICGGVFSGTAAAHVLTPVVALVSYTAQTLFVYVPTVAGTGACTVNVSGLGAKNIKTILGADPTAGDIVANQPLLLYYDGTNMVLMGGSAYLARTGAQTVTGAWTITGNWAITGDLSVSGALTGTSMTAKANKAGETYAGAHDFTAATITVATPTVAAQAVNKSYADGLAFSAALPSQAGNAGKYVTTDGVTASWGAVSANGGSSTTNPMSADLTLTSSSNRVQVIYPAVTGWKVILPAANTMTTNTGSPAFRIVNRGIVPVRVVTNGSIDTISYPEGGQSTDITLEDASTALGTWKAHNASYDGMSLRQMYAGTAAQIAAKAISAAPGRIAVGGLTDNKFILAYSDGTNSLGRALVVDISGTTPTYGTEISFHTTTNPTFMSLCVLSATQAIITYQDGSGANGVSKTLNISGSTVTAGAAFNFNAGSVNMTNVQPISSTTAMVLYNDTSNNLSTKVLTVSGTTITGGSSGAVLSATASTNPTLAVLSSTAAVILFVSSANFNYMVQNMAGSVITPGSVTQFMTGGSGATEMTISSLKDGSRFIYSYLLSSNLKAGTASVSSTTVTQAGEITFRTGSVSNLLMTPITNRKVAVSMTTPASMTEAWLLSVEAGGYEVTGAAAVKASSPITTQSASSFNQALGVTSNGKMLSGYRLTGTGFPNTTIVEVLG